jgi:hypothetical protein
MRPGYAPDHEALENAISKISERCFSAMWMDCIEYTLWPFVQRQEPGKLGCDEVTAGDILTLSTLSAKMNAWLMWNDEPDAYPDTKVVSLPEWLKVFDSHMKFTTIGK